MFKARESSVSLFRYRSIEYYSGLRRLRAIFRSNVTACAFPSPRWRKIPADRVKNPWHRFDEVTMENRAKMFAVNFSLACREKSAISEVLRNCSDRAIIRPKNRTQAITLIMEDRRWMNIGHCSSRKKSPFIPEFTLAKNSINIKSSCLTAQLYACAMVSKNEKWHERRTRETLSATTGNRRVSLTVHFTYFTTPSSFSVEHASRGSTTTDCYHLHTDATNASTSRSKLLASASVLQIALIEDRRNANTLPYRNLQLPLKETSHASRQMGIWEQLVFKRSISLIRPPKK